MPWQRSLYLAASGNGYPIEQQLEQHRTLGLAAPDQTVLYGTALSRTLSQALRARLRSVCPYGTGLQTVRNGI